MDMGHFEDGFPDVKCQTRNLGDPTGSNCEVEGEKKCKMGAVWTGTGPQSEQISSAFTALAIMDPEVVTGP